MVAIFGSFWSHFEFHFSKMKLNMDQKMIHFWKIEPFHCLYKNGHFSASFLFFHFLGKFKLHSLYLYHVNCHQCPPLMLPPPSLTPLPPLAPLGGEGHCVALIGHENAHARMSAFLAIISAILQNYCNLNGAKPIIVYDIGTVTVSPLLLMMRSLGAVFHRL